MDIPNIRYYNSFIFLSLDGLEKFKDELWLSFLNLNEFQYIVRSDLLRMENNIKHLTDNINMISKINLKLKKILGKKYYQLLWWIKYVFYHQGSDRLSETIWRYLCIKVFYNYEKFMDMSNFSDKLNNIGSECIKKSKKLDEIIRIKKNIFYTSYNENIFNIKNFDYELINNSIRLTISRNIFVELWKKNFSNESIDSLEKLYKFGIELNNIYKECSLLGFPGEWEFLLDEYYFSVLPNE